MAVNLCEPNFSPAVTVNIEDLRSAIKPTDAAQKKDLLNAHTKQFVGQVQTEYNVLPMFMSQNDHLRRVLSIKENEYLECRWNRFLKNVPPNFITIMLYKDYKVLKKPPVRRMQLNGQVYGSNNKLSPIPHLPDPREYKKFKPLSKHPNITKKVSEHATDKEAATPSNKT